MPQHKHFIVIDDDPLNNKICRVCIEKVDKEADVLTFTDPQEGFDYIASEYSRTDKSHTVTLFLDINMPTMNGWEFLELFDKLDPVVHSRVKVYILSSSVDKRDMEKAKENKHVVYYFIKPLTKETISLITYAQQKK
jgi:CheY-like chemotaxis protein